MLENVESPSQGKAVWGYTEGAVSSTVGSPKHRGMPAAARLQGTAGREMPARCWEHPRIGGERGVPPENRRCDGAASPLGGWPHPPEAVGLLRSDYLCNCHFSGGKVSIFLFRRTSTHPTYVLIYIFYLAFLPKTISTYFPNSA